MLGGRSGEDGEGTWAALLCRLSSNTFILPPTVFNVFINMIDIIERIESPNAFNLFNNVTVTHGG